MTEYVPLEIVDTFTKSDFDELFKAAGEKEGLEEIELLDDEEDTGEEIEELVDNEGVENSDKNRDMIFSKIKDTLYTQVMLPKNISADRNFIDKYIKSHCHSLKYNGIIQRNGKPEEGKDIDIDGWKVHVYKSETLVPNKSTYHVEERGGILYMSVEDAKRLERDIRRIIDWDPSYT